MSPKISVLIPVYNAEKYLPRCLASLQKQTFSDFEIICIDDGSTDRSSALIKQAALTDKRIRLFVQSNQGVAAVRNHLLQRACGEYVAFVDADDWVDENYLFQLYSAAKQEDADIARCFFSQYEQAQNASVKPACSSKFYKVVPKHLLGRLKMGNYDSVVWAKLYKRSWLEKEHISFLQKQVAEDVGFGVQTFVLADKIVTVPQRLYWYRKGVKEAITSSREKMCVGMLKNHLFLWDNLSHRGKLPPAAANQLQGYIMGDLCRFHKLPKERWKEYQPLLERTLTFLQHKQSDCSLKGKMKIYCLRLLAGRKMSPRFFFWVKILRGI